MNTRSTLLAVSGVLLGNFACGGGDQDHGGPDVSSQNGPAARVAGQRLDLDRESGSSAQDVTFFAFGDPQYGGGDTDKNSFNIQALNAAPSLVWPSKLGFRSAGNKIGEPRGV